jgi:hypothetical protein
MIKNLDMKPPRTLEVNTVVEHKHEGLPRFVCIDVDTIAPWKLDITTTMVEGTLNGVDIGRCSPKGWDDRVCWWMDLPEQLCRKAKFDTGDQVTLSLRIASEGLPEELAKLITTNSAAKKSWQQLTTAPQRMLREEILAAKQPATRQRCARKALGCD